MSRLLVTGATGLIGRQLLPQLHAAGYEVHAVAHRIDIPADARPFATWHSADLLRASSLRPIVQSVSAPYLLHLAWPALVENLNSGIHQTFLDASCSLLREFYYAGGARAVVAGTCFEYDWSEGLCVENRTPLKPSTAYGAAKDQLRRYLESLARETDRSWAWGRVFFVYGPHQSPTRFVPALIHGLLNQRPVPCTEGYQIRDYLHAFDVASALLRLLESAHEGTCNIGSGEATSLREIAGHIADLTGGRELLQFGARPTPKGESPVILADVHRLHHVIGWSPRFTLASGLAHVVAACRQETTAASLV
jgi:Nucleoside-diphosphate-sugar epimerases